MTKKQPFFRDLITGGLPGGLEQSAVRKAVILNLFSAVGATFSFLFGTKDIQAGEVLIGAFTLIIGILFISVLVFFRITKNIKFSTIANSCLLFILYTFLLLFGNSIEMILWYFNFPIAACFMLGRKTGTIFSVSLIAIAQILFIFPIKTMTIFPEGFALRFVSGYLIITAFFFIFEAIRAAIYKKLMFANMEKSENIAEAEQQTEELQAQAENLKLSNKELEKLNLVAEHTDNIVQIITPKGEIEWVNVAFEKAYEISFEKYTKQFGTNIFTGNTAQETKKAFKECIATKKTINYIANSQLNVSNNITMQITLSPTFNLKNEVEKVIAIETDISKLKKGENEIRKQTQEMLDQKEELQQLNSQIHNQNELLKIQNKKISESIGIAKKIQESILPTQTILNQAFTNFVLFQPKDVVSGDFYWYAHLPEEKYHFIAVADCTGHGVPGAFMSMIGNKLLNQIVFDKKITNPKEILTKLDEQIIKELKQETTTNNDGMDIALCRIEKTTNGNKVTFCSAKRPLFIFPPNEQYQIISGSRKSIGGTQQKRREIFFENNDIFLNKDTVIYLTSDGFADQNNPERMRFGTNQLLIALNEIKNFDLEQQKTILEEVLERHKNSATQRDDITILGIKL